MTIYEEKTWIKTWAIYALVMISSWVLGSIAGAVSIKLLDGKSQACVRLERIYEQEMSSWIREMDGVSRDRLKESLSETKQQARTCGCGEEEFPAPFELDEGR